MNHFQFSPETAGSATGGESSATTDSHVRHVRNVPRKDADLLNISQIVNAKWAANPFVTLLWKTQPQFDGDVTAFDRSLTQRNTAGGQRGGQTDTLENLDIQIEDAIPFMKTRIDYKFGPRSGPAHYSEFGMEHRHSSYEFPADREKRKGAIQMMIDAIHANGMDADPDYGNAFWTDIKTRYAAALTAATTGAGTVSADVSELVVLRTTLRRVLHSILLILEANYPDTFEQIKRDWGFLKEKY